MTLSVPSSSRCFPVTLRQVPARVRYGAAQHAARYWSSSPEEALDLIAAALDPSDTVYYVHPTAVELVDRWAA